MVLNPVRAGLAPDARAWRWSSYRATLASGQAGGGQGNAAQDWLAGRDLLALFAEAPEAAAQIYAGFVAEGAGGAAGFAEAMRALLGGQAGAGAGAVASEVTRVQR